MAAVEDAAVRKQEEVARQQAAEQAKKAEAAGAAAAAEASAAEEEAAATAALLAQASNAAPSPPCPPARAQPFPLSGRRWVRNGAGHLHAPASCYCLQRMRWSGLAGRGDASRERGYRGGAACRGGE